MIAELPKLSLKCKNNKLQNSLEPQCASHQIILLGSMVSGEVIVSTLFHQPIENPGKSLIMELLYPSFNYENARMTLLKEISWMDHFPNHDSGGRE